MKDGSSKLILKRLKSKPSGILDVSHSAKWLQLDRIHHDHVAGAHSVQTEVTAGSTIRTLLNGKINPKK